MRGKRERGSLLIHTEKCLLKISGRRAKRHFDAFIQTLSECWFEVKIVDKDADVGLFLSSGALS